MAKKTDTSMTFLLRSSGRVLGRRFEWNLLENTAESSCTVDGDTYGANGARLDAISGGEGDQMLRYHSSRLRLIVE